jgi:uncharacterized protein (DUF3820 family)
MTEDHAMPFGKYRGFHFCAIPDRYLLWISIQDWINDELRDSIHDYFVEQAHQDGYYDTINKLMQGE